MPKLEGRTSTRKTIKFEDIGDIASFIFAWDNYASKKPCQVEGCGHIVSGHFDREKHEWINCGDTAGAAIVYDNKPLKEGKSPRHYLICCCCFGRLNEGHRMEARDDYPGTGEPS